jgi:hypothetical protein
MTLEQFKERATSAELCLIERVEQLVLSEARKQARKELADVARGFHPHGYEDFPQAMRRFFSELDKKLEL